jgi:MFS transporter, PHS family, inorganic phosphate transporter
MLSIVTLCGSIVGQLSFGMAADIYGRKKTYGVELLLLIMGTLGTVSISGTDSMSVVSFLIFWRFITGIGIGAGYPLSAVMTAE